MVKAWYIRAIRSTYKEEKVMPFVNVKLVDGVFTRR